MNVTLYRKQFLEEGVFGEITIGNDHFFTLEHAYKDKKGKIYSKVKDGHYVCKKGHHKLKIEDPDFETFEVTGVKGHWGILFHVGNYNHDSEGCILIGMGMGFMLNKGRMLVNSRKAFKRFMEIFKEIDEFTLEVYSAKNR